METPHLNQTKIDMKTYKTPLERKVDLCKQFCEAMANWQKLESLHDQKETEAIIKMVEMYQERIEQKGFTNN